MAQFSAALGDRGKLARSLISNGQYFLLATQPPPTGTTSTQTDPFGDAHAVSTLTDIDVGNVDQMEMSTFESEATGGQSIISVVVW